MKLFNVIMSVEGSYNLRIEAESLSEAWDFAKNEAGRMEEQSNGDLEYRCKFVEEMVLRSERGKLTPEFQKQADEWQPKQDKERGKS